MNMTPGVHGAYLLPHLSKVSVKFKKAEALEVSDSETYRLVELKKKKKKAQFSNTKSLCNCLIYTVLTEKETKAQKDSTTWPAIQASLQASLWSSSGYFTPTSEDTCPSDPEFPAQLM